MADFYLSNHGTIVLIHAVTGEAESWLRTNTEGQWIGRALAVEPRYVEPLVSALEEEGFCR